LREPRAPQVFWPLSACSGLSRPLLCAFRAHSTIFESLNVLLDLVLARLAENRTHFS
jgi:hypothetical protein